jgi:hypothetical protein
MAVAPLPMRTILTISKLTPNNAASIVCPKRGIMASVAVHIMAEFLGLTTLYFHTPLAASRQTMIWRIASSHVRLLSRRLHPIVSLIG